MLEWHKVEDKLPNGGDQCVLIGKSNLMQGPITWHEESQCWLDLFGPMATSEAGTSITPDTPGLTHWAIVSTPYDVEAQP